MCKELYISNETLLALGCEQNDGSMADEKNWDVDWVLRVSPEKWVIYVPRPWFRPINLKSLRRGYAEINRQCNSTGGFVQKLSPRSRHSHPIRATPLRIRWAYILLDMIQLRLPILIHGPISPWTQKQNWNFFQWISSPNLENKSCTEIVLGVSKKCFYREK